MSKGPKSKMTMGVRWLRGEPRRSVWNDVDGTEPRTHVMTYDKVNRIYRQLCQPNRLAGTVQLLDANGPITCKRCSESVYAKRSQA